MEASILDLRRQPRRILEAIDRGECVTLSRRGKEVARIVPIRSKKRLRAEDHPSFGMWSDMSPDETPDEMVRRWRKGRFDAL